MKSIDLLEMIGNVDDSLIEGADEKSLRKNSRFPKWGFIAACFCICAAAVILSADHGNNLMQVSGNEESYEIYDQDVPEDTFTVQSGYAETDGLPYPGTDPETSENIYDGIVPKEERQKESSDVGEDVKNQTEGSGDTDTPEPDAAWSMPFIGGDTDAEVPVTEGCAFISSYGASTYDDNVIVDNGKYVLSGALKEAVNSYGSSIRYRVIAVLFKDGSRADISYGSVSPEIDRLCSKGYTVAYETVSSGQSSESYFTIHATEDQIRNFDCSDSYGYYIVLYGELLPGPEDRDVVYN